LELGRLGVGVLNIGTGGVAWRQSFWGQGLDDGWQNAGSCAGLPISFAMTPAGQHVDLLRLSQSGAAIIVDMQLPTDRPGVVLRCRFDASSLGLSHRDLSQLRRDAHRNVNHRSSAWAIGGMVLLLAVCGWIVGGPEGARRAVNGGVPRGNGFAVTGETMYRWFGARLLRHAEMPGLFHILTDVCRRARLSRLPDLYYLAAPQSMNAYALGGPDGAAIVLTEGLLRGMTPGEVAGILAHEVAHISNNDAWAMSWATALHRAIEWTSLTGLAALRTQAGSAGGPLAALLRAAPTIGQLLCLALSRVRELDADATALELTEDSHGLVAALDKLERHHTGSPVLPVAAFEDGSTRLLRSHPATSERVGALLQLTH
jgi:heat shock protein HtpX